MGAGSTDASRGSSLNRQQSYVNTWEVDTAPESGAIIPAEYAPGGKALLLGAYEESNTLAIFEITV